MGCVVCPSSVGPTLTADAWLPFVLPFAVDVPAEVAEYAIRLTAIDFAVETGVLTRDLLVDAMTNVADYPLDISGDVVIRALREVRDQYDRVIPLLQTRPPDSYARDGARFELPDTMWIYPTPRTDQKRRWRATVNVAPTPLSTKIDRVLFDFHAEAIGLGAVARVKDMPGGGWTDPRGAQAFMLRYKQKRADAKTRAQRNNQRGPVILSAKRWA